MGMKAIVQNVFVLVRHNIPYRASIHITPISSLLKSQTFCCPNIRDYKLGLTLSSLESVDCSLRYPELNNCLFEDFLFIAALLYWTRPAEFVKILQQR